MSEPATPTALGSEPSWLFSMRRGWAALSGVVAMLLQAAVSFGLFDVDPTATANAIGQLVSYLFDAVSVALVLFSAFAPNAKVAVSVVRSPSLPAE